MTTKQASALFNKTESCIRECYRDGMIIGAVKEKKLISIPDDTKIIPSKKEVMSFLYQILRYKNNRQIVINQHFYRGNVNNLKIIANYLNEQGYIGEYGDFDTDKEFFDMVQLTDNGMDLVVNTNNTIRVDNFQFAIIENVALVNT